ncbi:MAG: rhamnulokinase [Clostridiales Family XIII bacterium]|jgi:sugar (pentulose or hexulose) kinase|nr:rhamnulokinase [Clostridiales Family XIII bacterium]
MKTAKRVLAVDLGASSGRVMSAAFDGKTIALEEAHRFPNDPVRANGTLYWDVLRILLEIKAGIRKAAADGAFDTLGIDTWGVDFALLDAYGRMIGNPVHYRDDRTDGWECLFDRIPKEEIYRITGGQFLQINTLYQLDYLVRERPEDIERARTFLMMPDLIGYFLTGRCLNEFTNASNTQLLDARARGWSDALIGKIGVPAGIFQEVVMPGTGLGPLLPGVLEETLAKPAGVVCVASHDTGSAVAALPVTGGGDALFISSGTWSLLGAEVDEPLTSAEALAHNFTNEGGAEGNIRFLKNVMGSWPVQESCRQWAREGKAYSYADLDAMCLASSPLGSYVDVDDPVFIKDGNMPARVVRACEQTGQKAPQTPGEVVRVLYESLALKYRAVIGELEACTGKRYTAIHIIGGGSQSELLCRMAASATGLPVHAGPVEATALGNASMQLIAAGELASVAEARKVIADSYPVKTYLPEAGMEEAYGRFESVVLHRAGAF